MQTPSSQQGNLKRTESPSRVQAWFHSDLDLALLLRTLAFFLVAMVLYRTWEEIFFIGSVISFPVEDFGRHQVYFFFRAAALLGCALAAKKIGCLSSRRSVLILIGFLLTASTMCMLAAAFDAPQGTAFMFVGSMLGGMGIGLLMLLWFELAYHLDQTQVILCYLAAIMISPLVMVLCYSLPLPSLAVVGVLAPWIALVAVSNGFSILPPRPQPTVLATEGSFSLRKVLVLVAVFGFTFALREPLLGNSAFASGSRTAFGSMLVGSIVFIGLMLQDRKLNLAFAFRTILPITAVAFLLFPTDIPLMGTISDISSSATAMLVDILTILILANRCHSYGASVTRLFGLVFGVKSLAVFCGRCTWNLFEMFGVDPTGIASVFSVVAATAIALTMILLLDKKTFETWGTDPIASETGENEDEWRALTYRCHDFAKEHGLTLREEDILLLLAQDKTNIEIQEALFISKETVKTHRRNLYAKCGIHSREELKELLNTDRFSA